MQRMDKKHRFHARAGFFVTKKTIKLPTRSLFEWDLQLQSHELTHVGSGTFRRNRVGGAHPTWGYPRVGKALVEPRGYGSYVSDDEMEGFWETMHPYSGGRDDVWNIGQFV